MVKKPMTSRSILECECGCGGAIQVVISSLYIEDADDICISTLCSCFTAKQKGILETIKERIRAAWFMLTGKEYMLHDVLVDKRKFISWIDSCKCFLEEKDVYAAGE